MITVFGSAVLDLVTNVPALPRPGESVLVETFALTPGGKGANQALAARRAGAEVRFVGTVGDDDFGHQAMLNLRAEGVDLAHLAVDPARPTACATVSVAPDGNNQIVIAAGANYSSKIEQLDANWLGPGEILQLQLEIPFDAVWRAVELGREKGATVILNAAPYSSVPEPVLEALDILNMNEIEAAALAAERGLDGTDLAALAGELADRYGLCVIITVGDRGVICADQERLMRANALAIRALDTVGAGDAFAGAFAAALAAGESLETGLRWGAVAGSLACLGQGAQASLPAAAEIQAHLDQVQVVELVD